MNSGANNKIKRFAVLLFYASGAGPFAQCLMVNPALGVRLLSQAVAKS